MTVFESRMDELVRDDAYVSERDCNRDCIEMESGGTVSASSSAYKESDDVMNAVAEGYY